MKKAIVVILGALFVLSFLGFSQTSKYGDVAIKYNLKKRVDKMSGLTWYTPKVGIFAGNKIYPYIVKNNDTGDIKLRFRIVYYGYEWIFVERFLFLIDGKRYQIEAPYNDVDRDTLQGGSIMETFDVRVNSDILTIIKSLANAKNAKMRYLGRRTSEQKIKKKHFKEFKNVMAAYWELGGKLRSP